LAKELKNLDESPPEGINVIVNDDDFTTIFADIEGPGNFLLRYFGLPLPVFRPCSSYLHAYAAMLIMLSNSKYFV
jgi:hypothetical protein